MVLPVAAVAARVAGKRVARGVANPAKNAERHTAAGAPRLPARRRPNRGRSADPRTQRILRSRNMVRRLGTNTKSDDGEKNLSSSLASKAMAVSASMPIVTICGPLYMSVQLPFALVALAALGFESLVEAVTFGWLNGISPGRPIFIAAYLITTVIAVASIAVAGTMYAIRGITWWKTESQIWFTVFLAFSFIPILNTLPWIFAWMLTVIYEQR